MNFDFPGELKQLRDEARRFLTERRGRGGTQIQNAICKQEAAQSDVLNGVFGIGINLARPTICVCGTAEQRECFQPPALRIAGGADEIMRNVIAERVLGLPQDVPFSDVPTGSRG